MQFIVLRQKTPKKQVYLINICFLPRLSTAIVRLGAWRSGVPAQQLVVQSTAFKIHDSWNPSTEAHDIAVMRLPQPANLSDPKRIAIARLPRKSERNQSFSNRQSSTYGWGYTGSSDDQANRDPPFPRRGEHPHQFLHAADERTITNVACLLRYPAYIESSNICTSTDSSTPCDGDEGGALVITEPDGEYTIIGVHSYTFSLGCTWGWPAVFMRITSYLPWLENYAEVVLRD